MDEDSILCPTCGVGVLQQDGFDGGHLVCNVCFVQSQDAVIEQHELNIEPRNLRSLTKVKGAPRAREGKAEPEVIDDGEIPDIVDAYLLCLQHLLQLQAVVILGWCPCPGYKTVLKQIWKAVVLNSELLEGDLKVKVARPKSAGRKRLRLAEEGEDEESEPESESEPPSDPEHVAAAANADEAQASGARKRSDDTAKEPWAPFISVLLQGTLPVRATLHCHLLALWTLKAPIWASDLVQSALIDDLPFKSAVRCCRALPGVARVLSLGLLETPRLTNPSRLVMETQELAAELEMRIPELNYGAFVRRFCCELGVPEGAEVLAGHLAYARLVGGMGARPSLFNPHRYGRKRLMLYGMEQLQKAHVVVPVLAACRAHLHRFKKDTEGQSVDERARVSRALREWADWRQSIHKLREMPYLERLKLKSRQRGAIPSMLRYYAVHALQSQPPMDGLDKARHALLESIEDVLGPPEEQTADLETAAAAEPTHECGASEAPAAQARSASESGEAADNDGSEAGTHSAADIVSAAHDEVMRWCAAEMSLPIVNMRELVEVFEARLRTSTSQDTLELLNASSSDPSSSDGGDAVATAS